MTHSSGSYGRSLTDRYAEWVCIRSLKLVEPLKTRLYEVITHRNDSSSVAKMRFSKGIYYVRYEYHLVYLSVGYQPSPYQMQSTRFKP